MSRTPDGTLRTMDDTTAGPGAGGSWLLVAGAGQVFTHALPAVGPVTIGRAPECEVVVEHPKLSRRHAVLTMGEPPTIEDLGSTNGTWLGTRQLGAGEKAPMSVGESFRIGPFSFVLVRARHMGESAANSQNGPLLIVADPTPERVIEAVQNLAPTELSVLILGETGVGKELLAETVHRLSGRRGPLVRLNCAAFSESLLESELFGHEKGAFTGAVAAKPGLLESAAGGTVFLDEIGEMPLIMQAKLLRAIEAREIYRVGGRTTVPLSCRFVAATNRNLEASAARGEFRPDLFYRLNGVTLLIPPLRERKGMIVPLALKFLGDALARMGKAEPPRISPNGLASLQQYAWPGNVRELRAVIERAAALAGGGEIRSSHLTLGSSSNPNAGAPVAVPAPTIPPPVGAPSSPGAPAPDPAADPALTGLTPEQLAERARIIEALDQCAGNQTRAAEVLGISRATLVNKLAIYRVPRPRKR